MSSASATVVHRFDELARAAPLREALCALEGVEVKLAWSREALWERAVAVAGVLADHGVGPGDRVLMAQPDGPDLAAAMLGLWLRRALPIVAPHGLAPEEEARLELEAHPTMVLGPVVGRPPTSLVRHLDAVALAREPRAAWTGSLLWPEPEDLALVQYGSGPQLCPRGIVLSHRALAANVQALGAALGLGPTDRALSWSPMSHDMGLVGGLMMALWWGYPVDLLRAEAVLVRPMGWLEALGTRGSTITAGPNFAWQMCVRRARDRDLARLDLSKLRIALTGSETVRAETCRAFAARFAPAGFRADAFTPAYGLAEHVLAVSVAPPGRALAVGDRGVRLGPALPGHEVALRDGEIVVRGPSVMNGYLDAPDDTARVLGADGWLRTGDLGALEGGELVVLGRRKDMVIRRGKNFWIDDVETLVRRDVPVGPVFATAFADAHEGTEGLVVLAETPLAGDDDGEAVLTQCIVGELLNHLGLGGTRVRLLRPGGLPRTGAGLDRPACRRLALEHTA